MRAEKYISHAREVKESESRTQFGPVTAGGQFDENVECVEVWRQSSRPHLCIGAQTEILPTDS